jgi:hypothetical protein
MIIFVNLSVGDVPLRRPIGGTEPPPLRKFAEMGVIPEGRKADRVRARQEERGAVNHLPRGI